MLAWSASAGSLATVNRGKVIAVLDTSAGRLHSPPPHVHWGRAAARTGQSAAVLHAIVQLETSSVMSHAAGAMHSFVDTSHAAATFTQTFCAGLPTA